MGLRAAWVAALLLPAAAAALCAGAPVAVRRRPLLRAAPSVVEEEAAKWPTRETPPRDVLAAQLTALRDADLERIYGLFSRARRLAINESAAKDARQFPPFDDVLKGLGRGLRASCPGLLGHDACEILSALAVSEFDGIHIPRWTCRARVSRGSKSKTFTFTLTRQSDPPPPTIEIDERVDAGTRAIDGYEGCWFVWSIAPDGGGAPVVAAARPPVLAA